MSKHVKEERVIKVLTPVRVNGLALDASGVNCYTQRFVQDQAGTAGQQCKFMIAPSAIKAKCPLKMRLSFCPKRKGLMISRGHAQG